MKVEEPITNPVPPPEVLERPCRPRAQPLLAALLVLAALSLPLIYCWVEPMPAFSQNVKAVLTPGPVLQVIWGVLLLFGASASLVLILGLAASPEMRHRLTPLRVVDRPIPSVGFGELLLFILMTRVLVYLAAVLLMKGLGAEKPSLLLQVAMAMGLQLPFYVVTILMVVQMARVKGGPLGAAGIWPFWETPGVHPPRRIGRDVVLGVLGFALCFWLLVGLGLLNKTYLSGLGVPHDANPIVTSLLKEPLGGQRVWIYAAIVFSVVVVAPIAEEVLFRGLLYNVLCRHLDRMTAACAGALIFSFVHGVVADQWALFGLGLLLTGVYERTGRLLPAVVLHAANNAFAVGFMISMQP
jgi:membrane protease YdiL (CAAX protease family)